MTSTPLGIYSIPEVLTAEKQQQMIPTAQVGSFISQAASGLTTLEVAQSIKGEHFIDAIRIKVSGTEIYNAESREKIKEVANDLSRNWYSVDIVAGSAMTKKEVEIEGVGDVLIPWTLVGTALKLTKDFNVITFTTITLFTVFAFTWLSTRLKAENALLQEESEILAYIGWTEKQIRRHELHSQQIFLVFLNSISLVFLFVLKSPLITYFLSVGILLISLIIPYLNQAKYKKKIQLKSFKVGKSIHYYWKYYLPIIILMWISYEVISIITASQYRVLLNFKSTLMGETTISPVTQLMVVLMVLAYVMMAIAIFESISVILQERKDEFVLYKFLGWKEKDIYLHLVKESINWMFKPFASAAMVSVIFSLLLSFQLGGTSVILILSASILGCLLILTSKKIVWKGTTWHWMILGVTLLVTLFFGITFSSTLVIPILCINLFTLIAMSSLIFITLYISLKKFYRTV